MEIRASNPAKEEEEKDCWLLPNHYKGAGRLQMGEKDRGEGDGGRGGGDTLQHTHTAQVDVGRGENKKPLWEK